MAQHERDVCACKQKHCKQCIIDGPTERLMLHLLLFFFLPTDTSLSSAALRAERRSGRDSECGEEEMSMEEIRRKGDNRGHAGESE